MSLTNALSLAQQLVQELNALITPAPPTVNTIVVHAGQSLQAAHDAAPEGSVITIEPGTYEGMLTSSKRLTWRPTTPLSPGRISTVPVTVHSPGPALVNTATDAMFSGIGFTSGDPSATLITDTGIRLVLDRVVVLGDAVKGQHRGILVNGQGTIIRQSFVDNCFLVARDSQAILGYDGTKDLVIDDCFLAGGAETVMFGGADSSNTDRIPTNITITNSTLTKHPGWFGLGAQIKNALEVKAAVNVTVQDCLMEYAGIAEGQGAYLIVLTVRNQSGKAPWSRIENVLIERCLCRFGGGAVNFLGADNNFPSGVMKNVTIRNVAFTDINPQGVTKGAGRGFLFGAAPQGVTLDGITLKGSNISSTLYFLQPPPVGLTLKNMALPSSKYGIKIDAGGAGIPAVQAYAPDAVVALTPTDVGAVGYPAL